MLIDGVQRTPSVIDWTVQMPKRCPADIELTYHRAPAVAVGREEQQRADTLWQSTATDYYEALLAEDTYPYEVAETFGRRPPFLDGERRDPAWAFLRVGLRPRTIQYGDPQDMGVNQYTIVLERNGTCDPQLGSPSESRGVASPE
jgi:hypothetical protein